MTKQKMDDMEQLAATTPRRTLPFALSGVVPLSCTQCQTVLLQQGDHLNCPGCNAHFAVHNGVPIFGNNEEIQEWTAYHTELGQTGKVASGAYLGEKPAPNNAYYSRFIPDDACLVLDAGGGDGNASADWAEHHQNASVHVMDLSLHGLSKVQRRGLPNLIPVCAATDSRFPFASNQFDVVSTVFMVEHMEPDALNRFLVEAHRTLKSGGLLIVASDSPFYDRVVHPFERLIRQGRYVGNDPTHINLMTPRECEKFVHEQGFTLASRTVHWVAGRHALARGIYKLLPDAIAEAMFSTMYVITARKP